MLVFQKDFNHIIEGCNRVGIKPEWLVELVVNINLYLPDDWRMTRSRNNFKIQVFDQLKQIQVALVGSSFRAQGDTILHIIDTVFWPQYFDKYDFKKVEQEESMAEGDHVNTITRIKYPEIIVPNLYFFLPSPENSVTPLFARQYEKIRMQDNRMPHEIQYHRIHPLVRKGLDIEHFRWVEYNASTARIAPVQSVPLDYHGKDYWQTPDLGHFSMVRRRSTTPAYISNYTHILKEFNVTPPLPVQTDPARYENEYKLMIPGGWNQFQTILDIIRTTIQNIPFRIVSEGKKKKQIDTYLDDSDLTLHSIGASFRIRQKDEENIRITVKKRLPYLKGYSEEGLYTRIEEEAVINEQQKQLLLSGDPLNVLPYRLLAYIASTLDHKTFKEMVRVRTERTTLLVEDQVHRKVEISLDLVRYEIGGKEHKYSEVEIESKGALPDDVRKLASILEKELGAIISEQSKYERGISLLKTASHDKQDKELVIIDTDAGVDDALALILALKAPELDVKAITTVAGNVSEEKVFQNVFKTLVNGLKLQEIPLIARGADRPLCKDERTEARSVHGEDGLGDVYDPVANIAHDPRPAWRVICDLARENPKKISLVTLGPMTNAALAIDNDLEGFRMLKRVVAMGGVFSGIGNVAADTEFNIGGDPDAANKVVEFCRESCLKVPHWREGASEITLPKVPKEEDYARLIEEYNEKYNLTGSSRKTIWDWHDLVEYRDRPAGDKDMIPLTFVGLDVTHKVVFRKATIEGAIKAHQTNPLLKFIRDISAKYMDFYYKNERVPGCYLHDPLTVAYVINPAFLEVEQHIIRVETKDGVTKGVTLPDDRPTRNPAWRNPAEAVTGIARRVEREAFEEWFIRRLIENP